MPKLSRSDTLSDVPQLMILLAAILQEHGPFVVSEEAIEDLQPGMVRYVKVIHDRKHHQYLVRLAEAEEYVDA